MTRIYPFETYRICNTLIIHHGALWIIDLSVNALITEQIAKELNIVYSKRYGYINPSRAKTNLNRIKEHLICREKETVFVQNQASFCMYTPMPEVEINVVNIKNLKDEK